MLDESWLPDNSLQDTIDHVVTSLRRTPAERLFGHSESIGEWNTVWNFLRAVVDRPVSQMSDDMQGVIIQLANTVEARIEDAAPGGCRQRWLF